MLLNISAEGKLSVNCRGEAQQTELHLCLTVIQLFTWSNLLQICKISKAVSNNDCLLTPDHNNKTHNSGLTFLVTMSKAWNISEKSLSWLIFWFVWYFWTPGWECWRLDYFFSHFLCKSDWFLQCFCDRWFMKKTSYVFSNHSNRDLTRMFFIPIDRVNKYHIANKQLFIIKIDTYTSNV